ncbi:MAG: nitrogen regulation protein NR(II) [Gammaproteobacteria bacterium]
MPDDADYPAPSADQILEQLSAAILIFDLQQRLTFINPAGEMLLAHSARHAVGRSVHELISNSDVIADELLKALTSEQVLIHRGCLLVLPDAQRLRVNCTFTPISTAAGTTSVMLELRRVDHHLRLEKEEHLLTQQEVSRSLIRGLAHEIKNPLGGLRGAAQLLESEISDPGLKEYTRIIIGAADRLQNLIDRMLGPNNVPDMQSVNIHEVLERVHELVRVEAGPELRIVHDYDPSLPNLQADPDLLFQAVLNIVRNAVQALDGKGEIILRTRVQRKLSIGARKYRLVAQIDIIDNGPGIDEELSKMIFYPMITGRSEGTGLGLSIAQALIGRHQGLIECNSRPGKTVFTLLLPLDDNNES